MKLLSQKKFKCISICLVIIFLAAGILAFPKSNANAESGNVNKIAQTGANNPAVLEQSLADMLENAVILYTDSPVAFVNNMQTLIDTERPAARPVVINSRTLIPVRFVSTAFGAEYSFDAARKTAKVTIGKDVITLNVGESSIYKNSVKTAMDTAPVEIDGTLYIPLRSFADALDKFTFYSKGLIVISDTENILDAAKDKETIDSLIARTNNLPTIGTKENLYALIDDPNDYMSGYDVLYGATDDVASPEAATGGATPPQTAPSAPAASESQKSNQDDVRAEADYSTTNVQVEGVDEGDVLKTDGEYIYYVRNNSIVVVKAVPGEQMKLDYTVKYTSEFTPLELYVDGNDLVVIGQTYTYPSVAEKAIGAIAPYYYQMTKIQSSAITYDISDKTNVKKVREVSVDGSYISSRKIGSVVYMTSICHLSDLYAQNGDNIDIAPPTYRDTAKGGKSIDIGYDKIYYYPDIVDQSYTMITSFNVNDKNAEAKINTYLGGGQNIYVSESNMYVATVNYNYGILRAKTAVDVAAPVAEASWSGYQTPKTTIYKFALSNGNVEYVAKAYIDGTILNQFSMDEHNGFFRVATTSTDQNGKWTNNLLIFDKNMKETGKITNIAPGERIYSARFMGSRGYMVTFQTVDPLFAMDLSDPYNPRILGALKIPGYSDYLHPYDENHLIGFGKDTIEDKSGNFAYYLGMKISLFDVTDISNPLEMFTEYIGGRGTNSELLNNHKALLFSKEKSLLAFPVELYEVRPENKSDKLAYGEFKGQAAYVYNIDLKTGFSLKGTISHLSNEDKLKSGMYYGNGDNYVRRILYIGDTLYTVSNGQIKANDMKNLSEKGSVKLD